MVFIRKLLTDERGHAAVEYGLICGLIVIGLVASLATMGGSVAGSYNSTKDQMSLAVAA